IGAEALIREGLERGASGAVSGVAAAFPEAISALVRNPTEEGAGVVASLRTALGRHPFQASVKAALGFRGVAVRPDVRRPLRPLPHGEADGLRTELERLLGAEAVA